MRFERLRDEVVMAERRVETRMLRAQTNWRVLKTVWRESWTPARILAVGLAGGFLFGRARPLPAVATLEALQSAANAVWADAEWGTVAFDEHPGEVTIRHLAAPLTALLGSGARWAPGFLEGVYREWFRAAGMLSQLDIRAVPETGNGLVTTYRLSRVF